MCSQHPADTASPLMGSGEVGSLNDTMRDIYQSQSQPCSPQRDRKEPTLTASVPNSPKRGNQMRNHSIAGECPVPEGVVQAHGRIMDEYLSMVSGVAVLS